MPCAIFGGSRAAALIWIMPSAAVRREREEEWRLALAHPGLHGSAQMENPTKAIATTLRTIAAIATSSMVEYRLG